ncbi:uncharacterized protein [Chiloscyllium punctatum]|uniref:uncharacterized protein n=1 Tax=Chiloscyllium punctatum TaxID=137246 RepID=UPI003B635510
MWTLAAGTRIPEDHHAQDGSLQEEGARAGQEPAPTPAPQAPADLHRRAAQDPALRLQGEPAAQQGEASGYRRATRPQAFHCRQLLHELPPTEPGQVGGGGGQAPSRRLGLPGCLRQLQPFRDLARGGHFENSDRGSHFVSPITPPLQSSRCAGARNNQASCRLFEEKSRRRGEFALKVPACRESAQHRHFSASGSNTKTAKTESTKWPHSP